MLKVMDVAKARDMQQFKECREGIDRLTTAVECLAGYLGVPLEDLRHPQPHAFVDYV
jgi:hypothetical protein